MTPLNHIAIAAALVVLGVVIGAIGTLVGLGGGFAVVPMLLWVFRVGEADRSVTTATSLAAVFLNACSGTYHYARQKRIDYAAGIIIAAASVPTAVLGAFTVMALGGRNVVYDVAFAAVVIAMAFLLLGGNLLLKPRRKPEREAASRRLLVYDRRRLLGDGTYLNYRLDVRHGLATGALCGFVAGFLGIGGGIVQVPFMILLMGVPVHVTTATSQFILLFTTASATIFNVSNGRVRFDYALPIGAGLIIGAAIGARISKSVSGWVIRVALAFILLLIAIRMLVAGS